MVYSVYLFDECIPGLMNQTPREISYKPNARRRASGRVSARQTLTIIRKQQIHLRNIIELVLGRKKISKIWISIYIILSLSNFYLTSIQLHSTRSPFNLLTLINPGVVDFLSDPIPASTRHPSFPTSLVYAHAAFLPISFPSPSHLLPISFPSPLPSPLPRTFLLLLLFSCASSYTSLSVSSE